MSWFIHLNMKLRWVVDSSRLASAVRICASGIVAPFNWWKNGCLSTVREARRYDLGVNIASRYPMVMRRTEKLYSKFPVSSLVAHIDKAWVSWSLYHRSRYDFPLPAGCEWLGIRGCCVSGAGGEAILFSRIIASSSWPRCHLVHTRSKVCTKPLTSCMRFIPPGRAPAKYLELGKVYGPVFSFRRGRQVVCVINSVQVNTTSICLMSG